MLGRSESRMGATCAIGGSVLLLVGTSLHPWEADPNEAVVAFTEYASGVPPLAAPDAPAFIIYIAGPIELIGGVFVTIGLLTRWAAFLCSGLMAVAYWLGHGTKELLPLLNGGELAALYCFVFLFIAANGAGIWSVDVARDKSAA